MDRRCGAEPAAVPAPGGGIVTPADLIARARELDAADPLGRLRGRFALPRAADGTPLVYFCGHSLGLAPLAARQKVNEELQDWEQLGVEGHHRSRRPWIDYAELLQPGLARLVGAQPAEVVAMNSLSINLHLLLASFYRPQGRRRCIVIERGAFPSDRHAVASQLQWHGISPQEALLEVDADADALVDEATLEALLRQRGEEIALVLWPGVQYLTGQSFDLPRIAGATHAAGALCGFDLAHSIGNTPLSLHDGGADFAVWCSYKYLNAGPGAIGGAFVHSRHARAQLPGLAGWWGHDRGSRFQMEPEFLPSAGAAGWQVSNPPILSTAPLLASLQIFEEAGMPALRAKSQAMTALLLQGIEACGGAIASITPHDTARRGCQLSLRVHAGREAGRRLFDSLAQQGVVADWREPDILRFAPVPLYNTFGEVARFCALLAAAVERRA
ncbi:MAG: kynureninase [Pseudomonadota bacterium]|nr:kynureninase [Pseudomonadota bacterium]